MSHQPRPSGVGDRAAAHAGEQHAHQRRRPARVRRACARPATWQSGEQPIADRAGFIRLARAGTSGSPPAGSCSSSVFITWSAARPRSRPATRGRRAQRPAWRRPPARVPAVRDTKNNHQRRRNGYRSSAAAPPPTRSAAPPRAMNRSEAGVDVVQAPLQRRRAARARGIRCSSKSLGSAASEERPPPSTQTARQSRSRDARRQRLDARGRS